MPFDKKQKENEILNSPPNANRGRQGVKGFEKAL